MDVFGSSTCRSGPIAPTADPVEVPVHHKLALVLAWVQRGWAAAEVPPRLACPSVHNLQEPAHMQHLKVQ